MSALRMNAILSVRNADGISSVMMIVCIGRKSGLGDLKYCGEFIKVIPCQCVWHELIVIQNPEITHTQRIGTGSPQCGTFFYYPHRLGIQIHEWETT